MPKFYAQINLLVLADDINEAESIVDELAAEVSDNINVLESYQDSIPEEAGDFG